ncbi:hypothetical protein FHG68_10045 [Leptospira weilii]|nr:hypothetical protein FHG67_12200 [Leptospira weilii]QDK28719.1 hypothetical protein FHG68_10045 [Leptospira weilii]
MEWDSCKSPDGSREAFKLKNIPKGKTNVRNNKNDNQTNHGNGRGKIRNLHSEGRKFDPHLFG